MATTFGLCEVCFQSTFGVCCVACSNLLRCISGPETETNQRKPSTSREDDASSIVSSSSSDSYNPMEVDLDYEDDEGDYDEEYDEEYDEDYEEDEDTEIMILAQDLYSNGVTPGTVPYPDINFGSMLGLHRALAPSAADAESGSARARATATEADAVTDVQDTRGMTFPEHDEPVFPDDVKLSQKMSLRILVKGHEPYDHQTNGVLRGIAVYAL